MTSSNSTYICAECNSVFTGHKRKYCTDACRARAKHQPRKETPAKESDIPSECVTCGKVTWGSKTAAFCSPACRAKDYNSTLTEHCCEYCGNKYQGYKRKYCTTDCLAKAAKRRYENRIAAKPIQEKTCASCGITYKPKTRHKNRKFCSLECGDKHKRGLRNRRTEKAACKNCSCEFMRESRSDNRLQLFCSPDCYHKSLGNRKRVSYTVYRRVCSVCSVSFFTKFSVATRCDEHKETFNKEKLCIVCDKVFTTFDRYRQRTCSDKCQAVVKARAKAKSGNHRRRARAFNVEYEVVDLLSIFEAAGWRCQICGVSAPKSRRGKMYHNSPEIDHIIPMSKGGGHIKSNLQCACRQCNAEKSNKKIVGQKVLEL